MSTLGQHLNLPGEDWSARAPNSTAGAVPAEVSTRGISPAFLSGLHCPYCGSGIEVIYRLSERSSSDLESAIQYGILRCACSRYPIVEGVPILQHVEGLEGVIGHIQNNNRGEALLRALKIFRVKWARRSHWHRLKYHFDCQRLITQNHLCFQDAVGLVRKPQVFSDYLFHRYANPSFLAAIGPILLLDCLQDHGGQTSNGAAPANLESRDGLSHSEAASPKAAARVLDLACGAGHSSFLMRLLHPGLSIVSVDHDFVSLYLARRFVSPDTIHLCLDAEVPSPFANDYFDALFCLDAFHYLHSKVAVVSELQRAAKPGALWLFPHLHNALQQNITPGIPLPPGHYAERFEPAAPRFFDEATLLHGLSQRQTLDLRTPPPLASLEKSPNLTMIAGPPSLWRNHQRFPASFCRQRSQLSLNPIYARHCRGDSIECRLAWPNEVMATECRGAEAVLPANIILRESELRRLLTGDASEEDTRLRELVAQFVLVPLPSHYCRDGSAFVSSGPRPKRLDTHRTSR